MEHQDSGILGDHSVEGIKVLKEDHHQEEVTSNIPVSITINDSKLNTVVKISQDACLNTEKEVLTELHEDTIVPSEDSSNLKTLSPCPIFPPEIHADKVEHEVNSDKTDHNHDTFFPEEGVNEDEDMEINSDDYRLLSRLESPSYIPVPLARCALPTSTSPDLIPSGVSWSWEGAKLAVSSTDAKLRIYSAVACEAAAGAGERDVQPETVIKETEHIYHFSWHTTAQDVLCSTGRYQPVHLWSVGEPGAPSLKASFKCINQVDELTHAFCSTVSPCGEYLYAGLKGKFIPFSIERPGRESGGVECTQQRGILSTIAFHPALPVLAAGSYDKSVGLYSTVDHSMLCLLSGQVGGVTQVSFSPCGSRLYSGGRKDGEILCWDLRSPGTLLYTLHREVATNQRVQFCLSQEGSFLTSGNTDGSVRVWDLSAAPDSSGVMQPAAGWLLSPDAVTGVSLRGQLLASCSGQRHFRSREAGSDSEGEEKVEAAVKIWRL